ncbi:MULTISPECIES: MarR family transcriptional regulator [Variovorax]|jgi:DNA-binding MarR family transcriptional regulator|uniref:DNA-binding MarR family transcriptional regulator n=1 Tax=Variovorax paradoxus TaxID=34073 RepID=A0AAE4BXE6_VARPD|nr:MarR family transcriptional regulator [Variovorax paradoxus]MDR6427981.1 DNA-binding MarR family transcriptional regulator [Variovorax paradoxus]
MPKISSSPSVTKEVQGLLRQFRLENVPSHLLRRAHFKAEEIFANTFSEEDVTPRQKAALVLLHQEPGLNQNALAERLSMDRNTVAEMVKRMSKGGLIERRPSPGDARAYQLYVAPGGIELLNRVMPRDAGVEDQLLAKLPPEYRGLFVKCLRLIAEVDDESTRSRAA